MTHVNIGKQFPDAYKALSALGQAAAEAGVAAQVDVRTLELVKLRASQLNGCAFCLRMHTLDAIKHGETADRLAVLPGWWESQYFDDAERAALELAESVTLIAHPEQVHSSGRDISEVLTPAQVAAITWAAIMINAWNRVAICSHYPVAP